MQNNKPHNKKIGNEGEEIAIKCIEEKGYIVLDKNYHFGVDGEIDIIAKDSDTLVFIEVKTRTNHYFGDPLLSVTKKKQNYLRKAAEGYMRAKKIFNTQCRIDVIAIDLIDKNNPVITHLENAI
jgi:putative endonuclease